MCEGTKGMVATTTSTNTHMDARWAETTSRLSHLAAGGLAFTETSVNVKYHGGSGRTLIALTAFVCVPPCICGQFSSREAASCPHPRRMWGRPSAGHWRTGCGDVRRDPTRWWTFQTKHLATPVHLAPVYSTAHHPPPDLDPIATWPLSENRLHSNVRPHATRPSSPVLGMHPRQSSSRNAPSRAKCRVHAGVVRVVVSSPCVPPALPPTHTTPSCQ